MNDRQPKKNKREDQKDDGTAGRTSHVPRRISSFPLPLAPGVLTGAQVELVHKVIALAEAAEFAEAARGRRLRSSEFDAFRMPEFGSDVSAYLPAPETRTLMAFIDRQCFEDREMLLAVMHAGRDRMYMTVDNVEWLLSVARSSAADAGAYMTGKTNLVCWLKEGLRKFESYTSRMIQCARV